MQVMQQIEADRKRSGHVSTQCNVCTILQHTVEACVRDKILVTYGKILQDVEGVLRLDIEQQKIVCILLLHKSCRLFRVGVPSCCQNVLNLSVQEVICPGGRVGQDLGIDWFEMIENVLKKLTFQRTQLCGTDEHLCLLNCFNVGSNDTPCAQVQVPASTRLTMSCTISPTSLVLADCPQMVSCTYVALNGMTYGHVGSFHPRCHESRVKPW